MREDLLKYDRSGLGIFSRKVIVCSFVSHRPRLLYVHSLSIPVTQNTNYSQSPNQWVFMTSIFKIKYNNLFFYSFSIRNYINKMYTAYG